MTYALNRTPKRTWIAPVEHVLRAWRDGGSAVEQGPDSLESKGVPGDSAEEQERGRESFVAMV
jgi:hypothetical protein